jgi:23S rRNA (pseudouridine1915-N3)-methyltransferase
MIRITLLVVGKTQDAYVQAGIKVYLERLKYYCTFTIIEIPELKVSSKMSFDEIKKREGEIIISKIPQNSKVILLDENGKEYTSREFSKLIDKSLQESVKELCFIVGGAFGFSSDVYSLVTSKLSLSKMTFNHQMIRLFFVEQVYRGFSIINNLPYHHD